MRANDRCGEADLVIRQRHEFWRNPRGERPSSVTWSARGAGARGEARGEARREERATVRGGVGPSRFPQIDRPLVGRKKEVGILTRALNGLREGESKIVEIVGDPGVGKTLLLAELRRGAGIRGQVVLSGCASEQERATPLGMVLGAVDDHLGRLGTSPHRWIGSAFADLLAKFSPQLVRSGFPPLTEAGRLRLFRAVRAFLDELAEPDGLVLIFDDVHWADAVSAQLFAHLLRDPPRGPVLLALAYRPRQVSARLRSALAAAAGARRITSLELGPLSEEEAGELLGPGWSRTHRRMLYQASGGIPFYLEGLAAGRGEVNRPPSPGAFREGFGELSPWATAALRAELAGLSPGRLLVARAAAVAGDPFHPELVAELAELPPDQVRAAVDDLAGRDLIRRAGSSAEFFYRHPTVRQMVYETTDPEWRLAAHARAAAALVDRGASVVSCARHLELVARAGDERAAATLVEAASRTVSRAPVEAAHWLRSALRLLPDSAEISSRRVDLMIAFAKALAASGRLDESGDALREVVRRLPREQKGRRAHVVALWAMMERLLGRHTKVRAFVRRELETLSSSGDAPETAALKLELIAASLLGDAGFSDKAQLKELVTAVDSHPDPVLRAAALALATLADYATGPADETDAVLSQAARLMDKLSDEQLARRIDAVVWVGWGEIYGDRYTRALRHLSRGLHLARSSGSGSSLPRLLVAMARLHTMMGRLPEAADFVDEALEAAWLSGSDDLRTMALTVQCQFAVARGDLETALRAGTHATEMANWVKGRWWEFAWVALAEARLLAGDAQGCIEAVEVVGGGPGLPAVFAATRPEVFELLTRAELAAGRPGRAEVWAEHAEAAAERGTASARAFASLARSQTLTALAPAAAVEHAMAAAATFTRLGRRMEVGRVRLVAGLAHIVAGQQTRARAEIGRAEALFEESGARLLLERARQEQRRLVERAAQPPSKEGRLTLLTRREMQVAALVSKGHTNRQIAQRLGVTDKTVEAHLARVFGKLGVDSRASVAVLVAQSAKPGGLPAEVV
ncbi:helix-turn-helix transcriptional regulator [Streptosporangium sp. NPDC000396]|uniref:helix-turn-helix transcriptional regulator n=1 Tax=Streptosporangium sp. NPDC000396 TaxID=3366185 RepID=UPI0036A246B5